MKSLLHRLGTDGAGKSLVQQAANAGSFNQCVCVCVCFLWQIFVVVFTSVFVVC